MNSLLKITSSLSFALMLSACGGGGGNDDDPGGGNPPNPTDTEAPSISITSPTSAVHYHSESALITLGGNASDNEGVAEITWRCTGGCSGSGSASGTTDWSTGNIDLAEGDNTIVVTARDGAGNTGTDSITVSVREVSGGGRDIASETSECYDRIVTGGQSCSTGSIRCVGDGEEYDTNGGAKSAFDRAIGDMQPGDAMCVREGVYTHNGAGALIDIGAAKNCSEGDGRCFIASYPNERAVLHGAGSKSFFHELEIGGGNEPGDAQGQYAVRVTGDHWDIGFLEMRYFIGSASFAGVLLAGDHLRIHHNHIHNIWSDLIRLGPGDGSDDSGDNGESADHAKAESGHIDASDILVDRNYLHHSRAGSGINVYPSGPDDRSQVFDATFAYNVVHSSGRRPGDTDTDTFQPCSPSSEDCKTGNFGELGSSVWGNSDVIGTQENCHINTPEGSLEAVLCWDLTIKHNIAFKGADDCIDTTAGRMNILSNIVWYCGPAARRGIKDSTPASGPRKNHGNLIVGTEPMVRGSWSAGQNAAFFRQGTEWHVSGNHDFWVYNNTTAFWQRSGIDIMVPDGSTPTTRDTLKVINNLAFNSGSNFNYNGDIANREEGNNSSEQTALGSGGFAEADITLDWPQDATNEEIHRHLWLQFYNRFKPAEASPVIDAGVFIEGVHCANADTVYPYPLSTGYDDRCLHWTDDHPDIGAFEYEENGDGNPPDPTDTEAPSLSITSPTTAARYDSDSASITLGGDASDNEGVVEITWQCTGGCNGSGSASGTEDWSTGGIDLAEGDNTIVVTARDAAGNTNTDSITVSYEPDPADTAAPSLSITSPTSAARYDSDSASITLAGDASDNRGVVEITWRCTRRCSGSGSASGTTNWSTGTIDLAVGDNTLVVTARDAAGNTGTDSITVSYESDPTGDTESPSLSITSPTSAASYDSDSASITLAGNASDNVRVVEVTWRCIGGCSGSGSASGTTNWSSGSIDLVEGDNTLVVTARDAAGNTGSDSITVSYEAPSQNTPPVIHLIGDPVINLYVGDPYIELGATGTDAKDGDISEDIDIDSTSVNTQQVGSYTVTYNLTDSDGNQAAIVTRRVVVRERSSGGQDVVSETSECYDRIVTGGQSCSTGSIRCVGGGQEYDTDGGVKSAFSSAINDMQPGDAMCVREGTYTYTGSGALIDIGGSKNCSAGDGRCFIASYPNERAVLHGAGDEDSFHNLVIAGGNEPPDGRGQYAVSVTGDHWDIGFLEMRYFIGDVSFAGVLLAGDHLRIHHNHIHDIWSDLIRFRPGGGSDDSGVGAGHPKAETGQRDASDILVDRNYLHHSRSGYGIAVYPSGRNDRSQVFGATLAYNVVHSAGWRPDGTFQPCSSSADNCTTGDFGARGTSVWGNSDVIGAQKNCHIGSPTANTVRCWDLTIKHNIAFKGADDCMDTVAGRMNIQSNIVWFCGPAARRGIKDFIPGSGPRRNYGNLAVGTNPMVRGSWDNGEKPFFLQGTEWRVSGDHDFLVYNNTMAFWQTSGIDILVESGSTPTTADTLKVKNNLAFDSSTNFKFTGNINRDESNNFSGRNGSEQTALGTGDFVEADITLDWPQSATNEEIHRHLWLQFYNRFKPTAASPLIDAGIPIDGVHCPSPDTAYPYPLSTGYDDSCLHWTGSNPDIGAFDYEGQGGGNGGGDDGGDGDGGSSDRPWEDITNNIVGFAENVTGGKGAPLCRVTSLAASGAGTLRACAEQREAAWIVFDVSGTINLREAIDVQSNKTIDGRGADITLAGDGLLLEEGVENIIVHNIRILNALTDKERDAITIYGDVKGVWIDHCTFSNFTDGLVDITVRSTDVTLSWNHFYDHEKGVLISASDSHTFDDVIRVTLHHNYFNGIDERSPRLRFGKVHAFNNYLTDWLYQGMRSAVTGQMFVQNNIFEPVRNRTAVESLNNRGYVRAEGNLLLNNANIQTINPERVFDPSDYYSYTAETADESLRTKLLQQTGWQDTPSPVEW